MRHERPTEMTGFDVICALCDFRKGQLCPIGDNQSLTQIKDLTVLNIRQHIASVNFNILKLINILLTKAKGQRLTDGKTDI